MFGGNPEQWYTLLDNSKNAAGQIVVSSQQIRKLRVKDQKLGESQQQQQQMSGNEGSHEGKLVDAETPKVDDDKQLFRNPTLKRIIHYVEKPVNYVLSACSFSLLLLATILLIWQLVGKVKSYLDNPVLVTSSFTYPDSLPLPNIYFCNTKYLSSSYVSKYYPEMSILLKHAANKQEFSGDIDTELNMSTFYMDSTKEAERFFLQCHLPYNECNISNIAKIFSDVGICYVLNDKVLPSNISHAGTTSSLSFLLNVQSYDSLPGLDKTSDVVIALLDKARPPVVGQLGFHLSPGFHTSIALSYHKTKRLSKLEKGKCDWDIKLKLHNSYSFEACLLEQIFENIGQECGCYPNFMPTGTMNDSKKYCNAQTEIFCAQGKLADYGMLNASKCPETCEIVEYVPSLSFGRISTKYVRNVIDLDRLNSKITELTARDATTKISPSNLINKWLYEGKMLLDCIKTTPSLPASISTSLDDNLNGSEVLNFSATDRMLDSAKYVDQSRNIYNKVWNIIEKMIFNGKTLNQSCIETLNGFKNSFQQLRHKRSNMSIVTVDESLTYSQIGLAGDIAGTIGIIIGFIGTTGLALFQTLKTITGRVKVALKKKLVHDGSSDNVGSAETSKNVVLVVHEYETEKVADKQQRSTFDALRRRLKRKSSI
uniref:Uncharacterized protein n=1 Tax=Romanomermis culicivorax TaxID=13658 RepID=A0A915J4V9_ROMCU